MLIGRKNEQLVNVEEEHTGFIEETSLERRVIFRYRLK